LRREHRKARANHDPAPKVSGDFSEANESAMELALMRTALRSIGAHRSAAALVVNTYRRPNNGHRAVKKTAPISAQRVK
jgi:phosphoribosylpyrophosphate synthetase